jgi:hypothetical protein
MFIHEGRFEYFHIDMMIVSEKISNSPLYEALYSKLNQVKELTKDQDMIAFIKRLVPFAAVTGDEKLGMACFYYKDGEEEPMVVIHYLDSKKAKGVDSYPWLIYPMAINFSDFIGGLSFEAKINFLRIKQIVRALSSVSLGDPARSDLYVALCGLVKLDEIEVKDILGDCNNEEAMREFFPEMAKNFDPVQIAIDDYS